MRRQPHAPVTSDDQLAATPPLVCTADEQLLDLLLGWCSAVGAPPEVVAEVALARRGWRNAQFVLVGDDLAVDLASDLTPKRRGVFVVPRPGCPQPWDAALALGAEGILLPSESDRALDLLTAAVDGVGEACVVAVIGGTGGSGASSVAAGLAVEAGRRGTRTLLVDADPLGGGLDLLLGIEHDPGLRWPDIGTRAGPMTARTLADALPSTGGVSVLSGGREENRIAPAASGVLAAAVRGFDLVVCDVARYVDALASEVLSRSLLTVVVVPEDVRSVSASRSVIARVRDTTAAVAIVTAARRPGLSRQAMTDALGAPVVSRLKPDTRLRAALDHGAGLGGSAAVRRAVRPVLDMVGMA